MDRDLLFGVIAVQLGQATPQQVMVAASAYVVDKSQGIPERLQADGVIDPEHFGMLERMVDEALKVHGGDAQQTMQSLGGERVLFASFGGSLVQDEKGQVTVLPESERTGDSVEDADAVTVEQQGRYRVTGEEIGRGGIGRVLIAFDEHLGREIAVKELLADTTGSMPKSARSDGVTKTGALAARFLREARVTGQLEHPNIMPVYELGRRDTGELYYTMKLVRGRTLADALSECHSLTQRLELLSHFVDLCNAIAYAHSRGIIHRDIKTENVMLGEFGETVVLDWGLAKVKGKKDIRGSELERGMELLHDESAGKTVDGSAIGTPAYMSPEQADGAIDEIDARSDVWSLGAVLYELLTGKPPFEGTTPFEIIGKVMKDSVVPARERDDAVPAELSAVAAKALTRDKDDRYASARELAAEIRAYMSGGRIRAYEYSAWELVRGFVSRHKALSAMVGVVVLLIIGSSVALYQAYQQAGEERDRAQESEEQARQSELQASFNLAIALRDNADRLLKQGNSLGARIFAAASLVHNPHNPKSPYHRADVPFSHARGEEVFVDAYSVFHQATVDATVRPQGVLQHDVPMWTAAYSADGARVATAGRSSKVWVWDRRAQRIEHTIDTKEKSHHALAYSPDGKWLALGGESGAVQLLRAESYEPSERYEWHSESVQGLSFAPDSSKLAAVFHGGRTVLWDFATKQSREVTTKSDMLAQQVGFSPDGTRLATPADELGEIVVWDVPAGAEAGRLRAGLQRRAQATAYGPSGRLLAAAMRPHDLFVWDVHTSKLLGRLTGHTESVFMLGFVGEPPLLVSSGRDATVRLWDTTTLRQAQMLTAHRAAVWAVAVAPGADEFATASADHTVRIWGQQGEAAGAILPATAEVYFTEFSPDGTKLAAMGKDSALWDVATRRRLLDFDADVNGAFSPDGAALALTAREDQGVRIVDTATGAERALLRGHPSYVRHMAFSPDGRLLASGDRRDSVRLWDAASGELRHRLDGKMGVAFSPDGTLLATGHGVAGIRLWDPIGGKLLRTLEGHPAEVDDVSFSHDGRWLASGDLEGGVRLWDVQRDYHSHVLEGHTSWVNTVDFSPDDELLISCSDDWDARVWSVATKRIVLVIKTPSECVGAAFSKDGKQVALDWSHATRLFPIDLSMRDADPRALLAAAEREAGLKLDGMSLVPVEQRPPASPAAKR